MAQTEQTTLLEMVKANIRVSHRKLDSAEVVPLIEAAKKELAIAGVVTVDESDPMIQRAVIAYAKAHFGYDNPEAERFERAFNSLKNLLSQAGDYTTKKEGGADG